MQFPYKQLVILILICGNAVGLMSQSLPPISELLTRLRLSEQDSQKTEIHLQLAEIYNSQEGNAVKAIDHANLALLLADAKKDERRRFLAIHQLVFANYELKHDINAAMNLLAKAKAIDTSALKQIDRALLLGDEGNIYRALKDFEKAESLFLQQANIYKKENFKAGIAMVSYDLGWLYFEQEDYQRALSFFKTAFTAFKELNNLPGRMKTQNALGQVYGQMKDFEQSFFFGKEALDMARALNDRLEMAKVHLNLGFACNHLEKLDEANTNFSAAYDLGKELDNKLLLAESSLELGKLHLQLSEVELAGVYFEESYNAALETDSKLVQKNALELLCGYYQRIGEESLAYNCLKKLVVLKDAFYEEERTNNLIQNRIRYETGKREEELKILKANELESNLTIQKQRMSNYILLITILVVLAGAGVLYNAFRRKKSYNQQLEREVARRTGELEQSYEQLKESNSQLEQSNSELERFAYIASHDLKSPLRNVISFINLIERRLKPAAGSDIEEYLRFASQNARQMHQLIQDVLEFSRVDQKDAGKAPVDMNESLVMVIHNLKDEMERKNATVFAGTMPTIEANSVQVVQLFQNLISNGLKYNKNDRPKVVVSHREDNLNNIFSVRDNGIGISQEYHAQIFEMFKRLHTKEEYSGTGIGLALCKKIVQNLGGELWLDSQEGKGTTFFFSVPKLN